LRAILIVEFEPLSEHLVFIDLFSARHRGHFISPFACARGRAGRTVPPHVPIGT
jgi:hypothetical protein